MNENIKDLVEQMPNWDIRKNDEGIPTVYDGQMPFSDCHMHLSRLNEFAKLVVQDCLQQIYEHGSHESGAIRAYEAIRERYSVSVDHFAGDYAQPGEAPAPAPQVSLHDAFFGE